MKSLVNTLACLLDRERLLPAGSRVLVGVSGGVDSMVLLHLLHRFAAAWKWTLKVAHLNHQLRGRSSDADARFVAQQCRKLGVPCVVACRDVKSLAVRRKHSIEMAAREARHQFLAHAARRSRCRFVALAHHADDQAELVLLRLLRGSGSDGLGGMAHLSPSPADSGLSIVRPLLNLRRQAIEEFARLNGIPYRVDRSNAAMHHLRNRVRHELLPILRSRYQPAIESVLCRTAAILSAEADCIDDEARAWLKKSGVPFGQLPLAVQRRVIQRQAIDLGIPLDFDTVEQLGAQLGRPVQGPEGRQLMLRPDGRLAVVQPQELPHLAGPRNVGLSTSGAIRYGGLELRWQVRSMTRWKRLRPLLRQERFDADCVGGRIVLRHWLPGDRFQPIGMRQSVKLQDLFTNLKVPRPERLRRVVAVSAGGEVFWVEGLRVGERFKLRPDSRNQLIWRWTCY